MNLTKVLAISGKPGLYHLETQTRSGFLATSLADGNIGRHSQQREPIV